MFKRLFNSKRLVQLVNDQRKERICFIDYNNGYITA
jgi:hypothetical protein